MATDTLEIFGTEYTGVTGVKATDSNNQTKTYIRPQGTVTISSSGNTDVTAYATASVSSGSAGTPTATKGTVNNHSVSVTPAVTNSTGWITGSTKTGTAVTVSASELVSGSETKTANGTYDVTTLAEIIVSVSGGGGSGLVYESGTYSPTTDTAQPTISFSNSHSSKPFCVIIADTNGTAQATNNSEMFWAHIDWYTLLGSTIKVGSNTYYARRQGGYKGTSSSMSATGGNDTSNSTTYVSSSSFKPSNGSSYYWRNGRTYKWIAVWNPTT